MTWQNLPQHLESRIVSEISPRECIKQKQNKYRNNKPYKYGRTWDSNKELQYYETLLLLEKIGEISDIELQPRFLLLDTLRYHGKTYRKRFYIPDFKYLNNLTNKITIVDIKASIKLTNSLSTYTIKRHLFLSIYGDNIEFKEIY